MKAFYGSRISPNQTKTNDGFLVAHNVPISRTGWYQYLGHEVGLPHSDVVNVYRDPEEVFSPAAMASFEGKPLTDGHPMDGVNPDNAQIYSRGHVQNVRRGTGDESDLLLADLFVFDKMLQQEIQNGKREVSSGYEYDCVPNGDGTYSQRNIVGNHVAVVPDGRAGNRVRIKDQRSVESDDGNEKAAKKYGIAVKKDGHRTPPEGYPNDREQYADSVNYKYPLTGEHAESAVVYYNRPGERTKGEYTPEEWKKIGERIVHKLGSGYELKDGRILTPREQKQKGVDSKMALKMKLPSRKQSRVTDVLAAIGLKHFALDAEPDELVDAVDAMVDERSDEEKGNKEHGPDCKCSDCMSKKENASDEDPRLAALEAKVDKILEMHEKMMQNKGKDEDKSAEQVIDEAIQQMENPEAQDGESEEESHTIDPSQISADENGVVAEKDELPLNGFTAMDRAARVSALRAIKPAVAAIPDPAQRKKAADAMIAAIMAPAKSNAYSKIAKGARKTASDTRANTVQRTDEFNLGREWAKKFNPHYKERS